MISIRFIINNVIKSISCRRSAPASSSASQFTPWAQPTGGDQCQLVGILESSAARGTYAVERFAGAHPSHFVGPFSQGHGRPCLSIGTRATGSLLHGYLMQTKWCKKWHFFTPFISFYSVGVKNGTFLHQIRDSANAPPCYNPCYASGGRRNSGRDLRSTGADESDLLTQSCQLSYVATGRSISTWRKRREAELRTRLAEHLSG